MPPTYPTPQQLAEAAGAAWDKKVKRAEQARRWAEKNRGTPDYDATRRRVASWVEHGGDKPWNDNT